MIKIIVLFLFMNYCISAPESPFSCKYNPDYIPGLNLVELYYDKPYVFNYTAAFKSIHNYVHANIFFNMSIYLDGYLYQYCNNVFECKIRIIHLQNKINHTVSGIIQANRLPNSGIIQENQSPNPGDTFNLQYICYTGTGTKPFDWKALAITFGITVGCIIVVAICVNIIIIILVSKMNRSNKDELQPLVEISSYHPTYNK